MTKPFWLEQIGPRGRCFELFRFEHAGVVHDAVAGQGLAEEQTVRVGNVVDGLEQFVLSQHLKRIWRAGPENFRALVFRGFAHIGDAGHDVFIQHFQRDVWVGLFKDRFVGAGQLLRKGGDDRDGAKEWPSPAAQSKGKPDALKPAPAWLKAVLLVLEGLI